MRICFLFAMLIAVAMTLAPLAMPAGAAMASIPDHHGAMAMAEHCPDAPQPSQADHAGKSCCVAGCMALATLPALAAEPDSFGGSRERFRPDRFRLGYLGEIATPPPRIA